MKTTVPFAVTSTRTDSDRLDKLENMVEKLTEQAGKLATTKSGESNQKFCNFFQKSGHLRQSYFKLKTCNKCQKTGHNAKFCWESPESHAIESLTETSNCRTRSNFCTLLEANHITLKLKVGGKLLDFLYHHESQFSMIPKHIYDKLDQKPGFCPINKSEVGVAQQTFSLDDEAFMNIVMRSDKGQEFSLNYEPILVSSDIKSCIFGIHSENKFEEV